jgi:hypothetical protein
MAICRNELLQFFLALLIIHSSVDQQTHIFKLKLNIIFEFYLVNSRNTTTVTDTQRMMIIFMVLYLTLAHGMQYRTLNSMYVYSNFFNSDPNESNFGVLFV